MLRSRKLWLLSPPAQRLPEGTLKEAQRESQTSMQRAFASRPAHVLAPPEAIIADSTQVRLRAFSFASPVVQASSAPPSGKDRLDRLANQGVPILCHHEGRGIGDLHTVSCCAKPRHSARATFHCQDNPPQKGRFLQVNC